MGRDADAYVFYGYAWNEEGTSQFPWTEGEGETEWPEAVAASRGLADPWASYPADDPALTYTQREARGDGWVAAHRAELDAWSAAKKAIEAEFGVEVGYHGSGDYSKSYLAVASTETRGGWDSATRLDPAAMAGLDTAAADALLSRFVSELGVDLSEAEGPGWLLVAYFG